MAESVHEGGFGVMDVRENVQTEIIVQVIAVLAIAATLLIGGMLIQKQGVKDDCADYGKYILDDLELRCSKR